MTYVTGYELLYLRSESPEIFDLESGCSLIKEKCKVFIMHHKFQVTSAQIVACKTGHPNICVTSKRFEA